MKNYQTIPTNDTKKNQLILQIRLNMVTTIAVGVGIKIPQFFGHELK